MSRTKFQNLNSHLVILDVRAKTDIRLMNVYGCFSLQDGTMARSHFQKQLKLITLAYVPNSQILGDFNLDHRQRFDVFLFFNKNCQTFFLTGVTKTK